MKVIIASQHPTIRQFFTDGADDLLKTTPVPFHTVHFTPDNEVDAFVAKKLQSGFSCVILRADQFAFNELIAKTITI